MKLSKTDKFHAIFFTASTLVQMIDEESNIKPFTFPHVKDLCKKLVRAVEYNSKVLFNGNTDNQATEYAVDFINMIEKLVNVATKVMNKVGYKAKVIRKLWLKCMDINPIKRNRYENPNPNLRGFCH